jgi:hypothetical protein
MKTPHRGNTEEELSTFLEDALAAAESKVRESIRPEDWIVVAGIAEDLVGSRVSVVRGAVDKELLERKSEIFGVDHELLGSIADSLPDDPTEWPAPVRFAVKLILMERAIDRTEIALVRYADFRAAQTRRRMPERAREYIGDVVDAYLLGFDTASMALAGSCFEQLAKHTLIATGRATEAELRRTRPTAASLLRRLIADGLLERSANAATKLVLQRNHVLHKGYFDGNLSSKLISLDCLNALIEVCEELAPSWPDA